MNDSAKHYSLIFNFSLPSVPTPSPSAHSYQKLFLVSVCFSEKEQSAQP